MIMLAVNKVNNFFNEPKQLSKLLNLDDKVYATPTTFRNSA
jgi:hypothetical protein